MNKKYYLPVLLFLISNHAIAAASLEGKVLLDGIADGESHSGAIIFVSGYDEDGAGYINKIYQKKFRFDPAAIAVPRGGEVEFINEDSKEHNIFSSSELQKFDLGFISPGKTQKISLSKTGLLNVFCNIHPDMAATILILPNKAFASTDKDGNYKISNIKNGKWKVSAYHTDGKVEHAFINFAGVKEKHDFKLKLSKSKAQHLNKDGKPYSSGNENTNVGGYQ